MTEPDATFAPGVNHNQHSQLVTVLATRESFRDAYWHERDPIAEDRLLWRAQSVRHTIHLLPGQGILELGCGRNLFTRALQRVSRGENPITAVTFQHNIPDWPARPENIELIQTRSLPGPLEGRQFDAIVAMDLLDRENCSDLLGIIHQLLKPGGEVIFYESNPWNPVYHIRSVVARILGGRDPRRLINRTSLYELLSEIGFIRVYAVFNDFVFPPLTRRLAWWLRNLSILLENAPFARRMAGSILLHGQKPPRHKHTTPHSLCAHSELNKAVSFVIPCRNEEMNVGPLVNGILAHYSDYVHEIITLDDGSTDNTATLMAELAARDPRIKPICRSAPHGVGRAIAEGLGHATGRYVLTMDCDFQHLLPEFRDLFERVCEGCDVVVGSRFSRHSVLLNYPFLKIVANRGFHTLARLLLWRDFRDLTNNLKLMRREVVTDLRLKQPGFAANAETGLQPLILGYRIAEVPISWINRSPGMGSSSFRLVRVGGGYWHVLLDIWLKQAFGRGPYRTLCRTSLPNDNAPPTQPVGIHERAQ